MAKLLYLLMLVTSYPAITGCLSLALQNGATSGCPTGRKSCNAATWPGDDPIHNYMDYRCTLKFLAPTTVQPHFILVRLAALRLRCVADLHLC